jgi:hypothetical protein
MDKETRNEIKRQYKEEVHPKGIYCIRCAETDQIWVDSSHNLLSSENRLNFSLKTGMNFNKDLKDTLKSSGPEGFEFEVLEIFDQDLSTYELNKMLKERRKYWQATLSAFSLYR